MARCSWWRCRRTAAAPIIQRLHALDLVTLADRMTPVVIQATYPGAQRPSLPGQYKERGALLLAQGQIFTVVGIALRLRALQRLDHGLQRGHAGADRGDQPDPQRHPGRHLGCRRSRARQQWRALYAARQRHLRYHADRRRLSSQSGLRQCRRQADVERHHLHRDRLLHQLEHHRAVRTPTSTWVPAHRCCFPIRSTAPAPRVT